jgi:hypothetical protein
LGAIVVLSTGCGYAITLVLSAESAVAMLDRGR